VVDCRSELDGGRSIGRSRDDGAGDGIPELLTPPVGSGGSGKFGGEFKFGALIDLRFGGGNGATLGACSPARSGRLEELVPGRMKAGFGRKGTEFTDDPAKVVSASQAFFFSKFRYVPQLLPRGRDTVGSLPSFRRDFLFFENVSDFCALEDVKISRRGVPCRILYTTYAMRPSKIAAPE
jgi:hypothetical protein